MTTARIKTPGAVREDMKAASAAAAQIGVDAQQRFQAAGETAAKSFDRGMIFGTEQVEKAAQVAFQRFDEFAVFGKENVDAVVKSGTVFAKGFEDLAKAFMGLAQENIETTVSTAKAVMGCTTLRQMVDLQTEIAKTQFDKLVAEGNKFSEMSLKVANEALEPIQARVNVAVEKFVKPVSAA